MAPEQYTFPQLKVLWWLKRNGPAVSDGKISASEIVADGVGLNSRYIRQILKHLEDMSVVIRTYAKPKARSFTEPMGGNLLLRIELVDPNMWLPMMPDLKLGVVIAKENVELLERTEHEPHWEDVVLALVERNEQLVQQIDKLQVIVDDQAKQLLAHAEEKRARHIPSHLTSRVRDALPPETWERLSHGRP